MDESMVQPEKRDGLILVNCVDDNAAELRLVQPWNALAPIVVTDLGSETLPNFEQFWNA